MCEASYGQASLKITFSGSTSVISPWLFSVKPSGWFIQALAATTDSVPPMPATTIGTPVQKCGHGRSRFHPKM